MSTQLVPGICRIKRVGHRPRVGLGMTPPAAYNWGSPPMQAMKAFVLVVAFVLLLVPHANAQQMKLEIREGRVSLDAQNVPVRQILAEWARIGGSKIVNGEKVAGAPVTLQFHGIPERQALDIILRSVSGYMLGMRQPGSVGASAFDRILILPTSAGPRSNTPTAPSVASPFNQPGMIGQPAVIGVQPGMMGRPMPGQQIVPPVHVADDVSEPNGPDDDPADDDVPPPVFPKPGNRGIPRRPNVFPTPATVQPATPATLQPGAPATLQPGVPLQ